MYIRSCVFNVAESIYQEWITKYEFCKVAESICQVLKVSESIYQVFKVAEAICQE